VRCGQDLLGGSGELLALQLLSLQLREEHDGVQESCSPYSDTRLRARIETGVLDPYNISSYPSSYYIIAKNNVTIIAPLLIKGGAPDSYPARIIQACVKAARRGAA
jgi:hypothetical protein